MDAYKNLAASYDRLTNDVDYEATVEFYMEILRREGLSPRTVVDLACGTGSCATAVLCHRAGYTGDAVEIRLQEGSLFITVTDDGVVMTGPAACSFEGETSLY